MALRLGILGAALLVAAAINIGGYGPYVAVAGVVALAAAGTSWLVNRRRRSSTTPPGTS